MFLYDQEFFFNYVLGSGALDDKPPPPLLAIVNDESDCGIGTCSVVIVGVVGVIGVTGDIAPVLPVAVVVGLNKLTNNKNFY